MNFESKAAGLVRAMKESGRMPHAFLFVGENSADRLDLAKYTAKLLLCENAVSDEKLSDEDALKTETSVSGRPCGKCRHCRRIDADIHPDVILPERTGKKRIYNSETVKGICSDAFVRPNDCDSKVYIFADCEYFEAENQNRLLKLIEEPPDNVYFIFTALSKGVFLPTVLSRVATVAADGATMGRNADQAAVSDAVRITDGIIAGDEYAVLTAFFSLGEDREKISEVLALVVQIVRDACIIRLYAGNDDSEAFVGLIGCYSDGAKKLSERLSFRRAVSINDVIHNTIDYCRGTVNVTAMMSALAGQLIGD
jgi:DNA polymerase-3 subunit delta'